MRKSNWGQLLGGGQHNEKGSYSAWRMGVSSTIRNVWENMELDIKFLELLLD